MHHPLRIILADDEVEIRDYFQAVLERLGHTVVAAVDNGIALKSACISLLPDLVITDIRMPELDGDQAIREVWKSHQIPTILISAYNAVVNPQNDAQGWLYLNKPVRRAELEAAILAAISADRE
jgi:two-component system, response regulator PdtaR